MLVFMIEDAEEGKRGGQFVEVRERELWWR